MGGQDAGACARAFSGRALLTPPPALTCALLAGGRPHCLPLRGVGCAGEGVLWAGAALRGPRTGGGAPGELWGPRGGRLASLSYQPASLPACLPSPNTGPHTCLSYTPSPTLPPTLAPPQVALKIIRSKRRFQRQAAIEARILAVLRDKVSVGVLGGVYYPPNTCIYGGGRQSVLCMRVVWVMGGSRGPQEQGLYARCASWHPPSRPRRRSCPPAWVVDGRRTPTTP